MIATLLGRKRKSKGCCSGRKLSSMEFPARFMMDTSYLQSASLVELKADVVIDLPEGDK
jgi:hypothetical protein